MRQKKAKLLRRLAKQFTSDRGIPNEGQEFLLPTRKTVQIVDQELMPNGKLRVRTMRLPPTPTFRWMKGWRLAYRRMKRHVMWVRAHPPLPDRIFTF